MTFDWLEIIVALLGSGGIGALINAIASRKKVAADVVATLSKAYETRIEAQDKRIDELSEKNRLLEINISELRTTLTDRELFIVNLQRENDDLHDQVEKLTRTVNNRDKRVRDLERQVIELTERLDRINGCGTEPS